MAFIPDPAAVRRILDELEEAHKQVRAVEARYKALFAAAQEKTAVGGRTIDPDSVSAKVLNHLGENPENIFTKDSMVEALREDPKKVENALYNLYVAGKINRPSRGKYQAKQLQPTPSVELEGTHA